MFGIILQILKIIGIVLLIVLAVILLLLLCVLFVPVRYRLSVSAHPLLELPIRDSFLDSVCQNELKAEAAVTWFMHIVSFSFVLKQKGITDASQKPSFDWNKLKEQMQCKLRLFGISFIDFLHQKPRKPKTDKKEKEKVKKEKTKPSISESSISESENNAYEANKNIKGTEDSAYKKLSDSEPADMPPEEAKQTKWEQFKDKCRQFVAAIKKIFEKIAHIKYTINKSLQKLKQTKDNIQYYKDIATSDDTKSARDKAFLQLKRVWKHIKPYKHHIALQLGTTEPEVMGEILAVFGLLIPVIGNTVFITPYFDRCLLEGDIDIRGRVSIYVILRTIWVFLFDKDINKFKDLLTNPERG